MCVKKEKCSACLLGTSDKEQKSAFKKAKQHQTKEVEATHSEVLTGYDSEYDSVYDSESELLPPKAQIKKLEATQSEVLTGYDSEYDSDDYDSELLPPKAQIKKLEATSQELAQPETTPSKEEKSDCKEKGQQHIKELEPILKRDPQAKKTPSKKGTSACDKALEKLRRKQAKDLESPPQIKTPRPIGPDLCELNLTKYVVSRLFDLIM